jgi:hypothetical protein
LSGSGVQTLNSGVGELDITITATGTQTQTGHANPVNRFHVGLLRLGTTFGYYPSVPIDADAMVLPVWPGVTKLGYALFGGATIDVTEVFGTSPLLGSGSLSVAVPIPLVLSPASPQAIGVQLPLAGAGSPSAQTPTTANRSWLIPLSISESISVTSAFVLTGTTINGHWDVGVYDSSFALLGHTGSQTETGASSVNTAGLTLTLAPGHYWLAFSQDSTTGQYQCWSLSNTQRTRAIGMRNADSNFPLASTPTFTTTVVAGICPVFGISTYQI